MRIMDSRDQVLRCKTMRLVKVCCLVIWYLNDCCISILFFFENLNFLDLG